MTLIDIVNDTGKLVGAILPQPDKSQGKVLCAGTKSCTYNDIAEIMSKKTGKTIKYKQLPRETYQSFMDPIMGKAVTTMYRLIQDYGYFGPETEKLVAESAKQAGVKLNSFRGCIGRCDAS